MSINANGQFQLPQAQLPGALPGGAGAAGGGGGNALQSGGLSTIATSGGTTNLTSAQAQSIALVVTGTLTSNAVIQIPPAAGFFYLLSNQTTGNFTVTFQTTGGSGFALPQGNVVQAFVDNNGNLQSV